MAQVTQGKAFEYALLQAFSVRLSTRQQLDVIRDQSYQNVQTSYNTLAVLDQIKMSLAAEAAVRVLVRLEPWLDHAMGNPPLELSIQPDAQGIAGDVRDVLAVRRSSNWEIGFSAKHNHTAVKHSRLSQTIDFGADWLGLNCSQAYFDEIRPIFDRLNNLRQNGALWRDLTDKVEQVYLPLLHAFINELQRLHDNNPGVPGSLLSYLIGRNDFYKVISYRNRRSTQIQGFNMNGSLGKVAGPNQPQQRIPRLNLPTDFDRIALLPGRNNTVRIACNAGWAITARIHNASSRVEPSLKFDIQLESVPPSLYRHDEPWNI